MAKSKAKPGSPFTGRWHIASMTEWDEDFINAEVQGFVEFDDKNRGSFQFGYVSGDMDCRLTTRDDEPSVEWSWEGNEEMEKAKGRGWAVLKDDELHGMIFFHEGDESGFVAKRAEGKKGKKASTKKPAAKSVVLGKPRLYTVDVFIIGGPVSEKFAKKNPVVSRTIQIRGDQSLEDLHHTIFDAFGRWEEHMYEFTFGKGPNDPKAKRYVLPNALKIQQGQPNPPVGRVDETTIESLGLKVDDRFGYWFDFGDDWWHQINVEAIEDKVPKGKFPKVIKRVGKSPPQYTDEDE